MIEWEWSIRRAPCKGLASMGHVLIVSPTHTRTRLLSIKHLMAELSQRLCDIDLTLDTPVRSPYAAHVQSAAPSIRPAGQDG
jgi:hypothetical protein